ncbi:hypothetical protein LBYS11_12205 [Lysinibacillus sp. YS11]|uniref:hypothetical protein n=1 Tax=unclassified Lysinibacillus TaxID=2636778 RepID=UPI000825F810|nr:MULTISPECIES: hypothetical protein [unclassified Lysinibacillus]AUS87043.1 hypothetical protein LBYS11_12205 [Lysinibacillus sp. YS11]OCX62716.1 hypothetical protein BFM98_01580 [Lysinibacillus sp. AR18-8]
MQLLKPEKAYFSESAISHLKEKYNIPPDFADKMLQSKIQQVLQFTGKDNWYWEQIVFKETNGSIFLCNDSEEYGLPKELYLGDATDIVCLV